VSKRNGNHAFVALFGAALLLAGCAKEEVQKPRVSDPALVKTWVKFGSPTKTMTLVLKLDSSFEADFIGDAQIDVWGDYFPVGRRITFVDQGGQQACPADSGVYRYSVAGHELLLSLIQDACRGRIGPTVGTWTDKGVLEACNKAIAANPQDVKAYEQRGRIKFILLDHQGALADFEKAIEMSTDYASAYAGRASVKSTFLKDFSGAVDDFGKAIELDPEYQKAYFDRGLMKYYLKDRDGACADWKKSLELGFTQAENVIEQFCE